MKFFQKTIIATLLLFSLFSILPSTKIQAHDAYFLRVTVNESNYTFEGSVEHDRVTQEANHAELQLGNFSEMKEKLTTSYSTYDQRADGVPHMIFSFPSKDVQSASRASNHAGAQDAERAYSVNNVLIPNLNQMVITLNDNKPHESLASFKEAVEKIITAESLSENRYVEHNGWRITRNSTNRSLTLTKAGFQTRTFKYSVTKGYNKSLLDNGQKSPVYATEFGGDTTYITTGMLASQGMYAMEVKNITATNITEQAKPGILEKTLSTFFNALLNGLRSILGLYSIDELVFNRGDRMQYEFAHGTMRWGWMNVATAFHTIFLVLAYIMIAFSVIKIMFEKTLSTFSIFKQISLMNSIKNIIITGFLLAASYLLLQGVLIVNSRLVSVFAGANPGFTTIGQTTPANGTFASIILSFFYFIVSVYLNFIYIVRALTIAVLIASAPIFIASIAFSSKGSQMFMKWAKELLANIFMQSIHAFILGITLSLQMGATGIEQAVIAFSLIPITKLFRSLIFGEAGSMGENVATGMTAGAVGIAAGAAAKKGKSGGAGSGETAPGANTHRERKEHSVDTPSSKETSETLTASPAGIGDGGAGTGMSSKIGATFHKNDAKIDGAFQKLSTRKDGTERDLSDIQNFSKKVAGAATVAKPLAKTAAGATMAAGALGAQMAVGAVAGPQAMKSMQGMTNTALNFTKDGVRETAGTVADGVSDLRNRSNLNGTMLGAEKTPDGSTVVHRDLSKMREMGIENGYKSHSGVGIEYNPERMSGEDAQNLQKVRALQPKEWSNHGINHVKEHSNGHVAVEYSDVGLRKLGFDDLYKTKNRLVETKPSHSTTPSRFTYDPYTVTTNNFAKEKNLN